MGVNKPGGGGGEDSKLVGGSILGTGGLTDWGGGVKMKC